MSIKIVRVKEELIKGKYTAVFRSYPIPYMKPKILLTDSATRSTVLHEMVHYKQWKENRLHTLRAYWIPSYRLKIEAEAYAHELLLSMVLDFNHFRRIVIALKRDYNLGYSATHISDALIDAYRRAKLANILPFCEEEGVDINDYK